MNKMGKQHREEENRGNWEMCMMRLVTRIFP